MADAIHSITYRKESAEYRIVRRDLVTGKFSSTYANHLTEQEKLWAKINCKTRHEDPYSIQWTIHHSKYREEIEQCPPKQDGIQA